MVTWPLFKATAPSRDLNRYLGIQYQDAVHAVNLATNEQ